MIVNKQKPYNPKLHDLDDIIENMKKIFLRLVIINFDIQGFQ